MELSELFDEFVEEYNHGNNPRIEDYLHKCPTSEKEFQRIIEAFLMARHNLPRNIQQQSWQAFSESFFASEMNRLEQLEGIHLGDALTYLSQTISISRDAVIEALMEKLGLEPKNREKRERFNWQYHRLENNFINARYVSHRLLKAAADVFQIPIAYLEAARQRASECEETLKNNMQDLARVAETRGTYRVHSHHRATDDQFADVDQLFIET